MGDFNIDKSMVDSFYFFTCGNNRSTNHVEIIHPVPQKEATSMFNVMLATVSSVVCFRSMALLKYCQQKDEQCEPKILQYSSGDRNQHSGN
jgi:hypothetical protein